MRALWLNILVVVNKSHKYLQLSHQFWKLEVGDGFHLIHKWLDPISCETESKLLKFVFTEEQFVCIEFQSCLRKVDDFKFNFN